MAILTSKQLIEECKRMAGIGSALEKTEDGISYYADRWGYVLGGQGELYSLTLAARWGAAQRANKTTQYFVRDCAHWFGRRVVDCSGMIIEAYRKYKPGFGDKTANYLYNSYTTKRGKIENIPDVPGIVVWKSGHIGVYVGDGKVIEARGYRYGVVVSELFTQAWIGWGYLRDVSYEEDKETSVVPSVVFDRLLKYTEPFMRGEDVTELQRLLETAGYSPGSIDGAFGAKTRSTVIAFQRSKGLTADGIAGENTVTALGGRWKGSSSATAQTPATWTVSRVLKRTDPLMSGEDVLALKKALLARSYLKAATKKTFGDDTDKAVRAFQKDKGLAVDGKAGEKTVNALGGIWEG